MSKFTKLEREYVKGVVHNLSFQRFSDREIVEWLRNEKKIEVSRSTINRITREAEQDAARWYTELRQSGVKYVAIYKQRLDSLLSYQKKLHEIINRCSSPEIILKSISELHRIELSLHTLMKELPGDIQIEIEQKLNLTVSNEIPTEHTDHSSLIGGEKGALQPLCDGDTWIRCNDCHIWFRENVVGSDLKTHKQDPYLCSHIFTEMSNKDKEILKFKFEYAELKLETESTGYDEECRLAEKEKRMPNPIG